jgi:hypothetical protein
LQIGEAPVQEPPGTVRTGSERTADQHDDW